MAGQEFIIRAAHYYNGDVTVTGPESWADEEEECIALAWQDWAEVGRVRLLFTAEEAVRLRDAFAALVAAYEGEAALATRERGG